MKIESSKSRGSETKQDIIVYYAKDKYHQDRFMNSIKYRKALALGKWDWSAVFNEKEKQIKTSYT